MKYKPVIGLEIHIQAKTKSKMFCTCSAEYFGDAPNTHVCPVCLGLPGALPVPNKAGVEQCIKLALGLNCTINQQTKFDRKNYFYPDLPKAYQISQYDLPIGHDGYLEIDVEGDSRRIRIKRVHLEEDTGKSIHQGTNTYLDFNKSGVPLIEVVTEPDFDDIAEVTQFSKLLKQTVEYLGVSDAEMQKGQMRFELNISLRTNEPAGKLPGYRVEVKNIGSISVLEKVIEFEISRQTAEIDAGRKLQNETRGLKDMTGETVSQRVKETENDYRYFPEPDIPPILISQEQITEIAKLLGELPTARRQRYIFEFGLEPDQADLLVDQPQKGDWIDALAKLTQNKQHIKEAVKWLTGEVSGLLERSPELNMANLPVSHQDILEIIGQLEKQVISGSIAKQVLAELFTSGGTAAEIIKSKGLEQVSDDTQIMEWAKQAIAQNPDIVANISKNPNAIKALVGKVMGMSKGKANPRIVEQSLTSLLAK